MEELHGLGEAVVYLERLSDVVSTNGDGYGRPKDSPTSA